MNHNQNDRKPAEGFDLLNQETKKRLIAQGYMDEDERMCGAGKHLIPLLLETIKTGRAMSKITSAKLEDDEQDDEETSESLELTPFLESLHQAIDKTRKDLHEDGYQNVEERYGEVILPSMNWVFCLQYSYWMAEAVPFDLITKDSRAFTDEHPDGCIFTLQLFREFVREKGAK